MNTTLVHLIRLLKDDLRIFLAISMGIFLFVLFFQPFPIEHFDFNNSLLFVAGLGVIVFVFMVLVRIIFPWFSRRNYPNHQERIVHSYYGSFIILVASTVAFAFYLHYVGSVSLTFYIMFKVALICLAPVAILRIYDILKVLKNDNEALIIEKKVLQTQVEKFEEDFLSKTVEFVSENNSENFSLTISDIAFIKSADNYVEIAYKEGDSFKRKLLRNTLKNTEQQIRQYSNFIRCHRICIVNTHYIEKLNRDYNSHWLTIKGFEEQLPVSRQYLLKLKETL